MYRINSILRKKGSFICKICGKTFDTVPKLGRHTRDHLPKSRSTKGRRFTRPKKKCDICGKMVCVSFYPKHKCKISKSTISLDKKWQISDKEYSCPYCKKIFSKKGICSHIWLNHGGGQSHRPLKDFKTLTGNTPWNKGLTMATDKRVLKMSLIQKGKSKKGHKMSNTQKQFLSILMKEKHKKGIAHNIGSSRWNRVPSYPEKFFMKVIENEFYDKNYKYEFSVGKYSIDFAWIDIKKAIELDGDQHERSEYLERDKRKDKFLLSQGWEILRIKWKDMYKDTKKYIAYAYNFIHFI